MAFVFTLLSPSLVKVCQEHSSNLGNQQDFPSPAIHHYTKMLLGKGVELDKFGESVHCTLNRAHPKGFQGCAEKSLGWVSQPSIDNKVNSPSVQWPQA